MKRLAPPSIPWLQGIPELWRAVLDELARDESLADANAAMRRYLTRCMLSVDRRRAGAAALSALVESNHLQAELAVLIEGRFRALRHRPVQLLLAAERLADDLREGHAGFLSRCLPRELIEGVAAAIFGDVRAALRLLALLELPGRTPAMAASILHCLPGGWRPKEVRSWQLPGAFLSNAAWAGVEMRRAHLERVDLCQADLTGAMLEHSYLDSAQLRGARLAGALLTSIHATKADFYGADLSGASAKSARFLDANLARANLAGAVLREADLSNANLADACLERADLTGATLTGAVLSGADFTDANLEGAYLQHLVLRDADFTGSSFVAANLRHCDLEEMNLPAADFARANLQCAVLTGSKVHGANFCAANLSEAGLADIDWEGADLRMANLTNASFHLGSSRSGRVGSPVAMEGSMTGFYTDDFEEQRFKSPEDIRKANLCGADLRGAKVMDTDFYLVDLRSAKYDPEQEEHFRRCRAILENVD